MSKGDAFDLQEFLPYLLNIAGEQTSAGFQTIYRSEFGLLRTDWRVLFHLGIYGELTAKEICERAHIHKTKVSRAVARLAERRLVSRESRAQDRRFESLRLTARGRQIYQELRSSAQAHNNQLLEPFSKQEAEVLIRALKRLAESRSDAD